MYRVQQCFAECSFQKFLEQEWPFCSSLDLELWVTELDAMNGTGIGTVKSVSLVWNWDWNYEKQISGMELRLELVKANYRNGTRDGIVRRNGARIGTARRNGTRT